MSFWRGIILPLKDRYEFNEPQNDTVGVLVILIMNVDSVLQDILKKKALYIVCKDITYTYFYQRKPVDYLLNGAVLYLMVGYGVRHRIHLLKKGSREFDDIWLFRIAFQNLGTKHTE